MLRAHSQAKAACATTFGRDYGGLQPLAQRQQEARTRPQSVAVVCSHGLKREHLMRANRNAAGIAYTAIAIDDWRYCFDFAAIECTVHGGGQPQK